MLHTNSTTLIDGYKLDHRRQAAPGLTNILANWTPRTSRIPGITHVHLLGVQLFLMEYLGEDLQKNFFDRPIEEVCEAFTRRVNGYLGPNTIGDQHIRDWHTLGFTPLLFKAVPEGSKVPIRVPMLTVEVSPGFDATEKWAWLVNYYETLFSCTVWMPCTSLTMAVRFRNMLENWARFTGTPVEFTQWQGHDFSMRGMAGLTAAILSGIGHLGAFTGTDTIPAIDAIEKFYFGTGLIGGSVPATEHAVMCSGGQMSEMETFERLLELYPSGIVSVVSDTWDLWHVLTKILPQLKDKITARDGKLVIRPDSGDPVLIVCGDPDAPEGSPARKGVIELLWEVFGGTHTERGYRMLDSHIGCIYGDAITFERGNEILSRLERKGFASGNIVFGVGSFTYQYVTRDTFGFAMKSTWAQVNGEGRDLEKKPITDNGTKFSARGRIAVLYDEAVQDLILVNNATKEQEAQSALKPIWCNGQFLKVWTWDEVRANTRL